MMGWQSIRTNGFRIEVHRSVIKEHGGLKARRCSSDAYDCSDIWHDKASPGGKPGSVELGLIKEYLRLINEQTPQIQVQSYRLSETALKITGPRTIAMGVGSCLKPPRCRLCIPLSNVSEYAGHRIDIATIGHAGACRRGDGRPDPLHVHKLLANNRVAAVMVFIEL